MPRNPDPCQIAREAVTAIRELNHATLDLTTMPVAGEISTTVIALIDLIDRLPQTLDQLAAGLRDVQQRDQIRLDHDGDLQAEVQAALKGLQDAQEALPAVSKALGEASAPLFHMGAPYTPSGDDEDDV